MDFSKNNESCILWSCFAMNFLIFLNLYSDQLLANGANLCSDQVSLSGKAVYGPPVVSAFFFQDKRRPSPASVTTSMRRPKSSSRSRTSPAGNHELTSGPVVIRNPNGFIATRKVSSENWIYCNTVGQEDAGEYVKYLVRKAQ